MIFFSSSYPLCVISIVFPSFERQRLSGGSKPQIHLSNVCLICFVLLDECTGTQLCTLVYNEKWSYLTWYRGGGGVAKGWWMQMAHRQPPLDPSESYNTLLKLKKNLTKWLKLQLFSFFFIHDFCMQINKIHAGNKFPTISVGNTVLCQVAKCLVNN